VSCYGGLDDLREYERNLLEELDEMRRRIRDLGQRIVQIFL